MGNVKSKYLEHPCAFWRYDEGYQKPVKSHPPILCGHRCESCGWNPAEQQRRLETGVWKKHRGIRTLHFKFNRGVLRDSPNT